MNCGRAFDSTDVGIEIHASGCDFAKSCSTKTSPVERLFVAVFRGEPLLTPTKASRGTAAAEPAWPWSVTILLHLEASPLYRQLDPRAQSLGQVLANQPDLARRVPPVFVCPAEQRRPSTRTACSTLWQSPR